MATPYPSFRPIYPVGSADVSGKLKKIIVSYSYRPQNNKKLLLKKLKNEIEISNSLHPVTENYHTNLVDKFFNWN
jgi:hypothetical protein